jgi:hypothetical protein
MARPCDTMTQRHQHGYELRTADGTRFDATGSRKTAARWLATIRELPEGWHVTCALTTWFASERTDADDLERWHAHLDRRYGL